jgi:cbb3-type cytochrome oxidase subunit 3
MADDLAFLRRKEEAKSWGALCGVLFLVAVAWWIFHS